MKWEFRKSGIKNVEKSFYFPACSKWIFVILFVAVSVYYEIPEKLSYRPQGIHAWRQSDCLSIALNYYMEGMKFFEPKIHNVCIDGSGKTVSDFPLLYYSAALLWKVFGYHEIIYRLLVLLIAFSGLYCLFLTMERLYKDSFWALGIALLVFTSPLFVYYSNNFLSNIPALSFVFAAWFFFMKFYFDGRSRHLWFSMFFFLLGGLIKTTALYTYIPLAFFYLTELTGVIKYRGERKIFSRPFSQSFPLFLVPLFVFFWYLWAYRYNQAHNSNVFLIGILPVWELTKDQINNILHHIEVLWLNVYFHRTIQIIAVIFYLIMIFSFRKMNRTLYVVLLLMGAGFFGYLSLWFLVLDHHDYYLIDLLAFLVITIISFFLFLKDNFPRIFNSLYMRLLFSIFLIYQINYCSVRVNERYTGWRNEQHISYFKPLESITPYLRSLGIERKDKVISVPDGSINITLYLMDQKGWTNYNFPGKKFDSAVVLERIRHGAKYLIVNDTVNFSHNEFKGINIRKAGDYGSVIIYELPFEK